MPHTAHREARRLEGGGGGAVPLTSWQVAAEGLDFGVVMLWAIADGVCFKLAMLQLVSDGITSEPASTAQNLWASPSFMWIFSPSPR